MVPSAMIIWGRLLYPPFATKRQKNPFGILSPSARNLSPYLLHQNQFSNIITMSHNHHKMPYILFQHPLCGHLKGQLWAVFSA